VVTGIGATDFFAAQRANRRRTLMLLAVLTLIAAGLGYLIGWYFDAGSYVHPGIAFLSPAGAVMALGVGAVSIGWSAVSLAWGGRMVLAMTGGHEVTKQEEQQLFNVVEEMSIAAGQPVPRVFVIEDAALNAFATGTSSGNAAIGVTRGLLQALNREELQGVIGHEMGHIANLDMRYMTVVGVTVGLVALLGDMILRFMNWGPGRSRDRGRGGSGGAVVILFVILMVVAIVAPLAARLVQFAVSRQREYLADATAVQFTRNPAGLISALRKLTDAARPFAGASRATQHLFIVNPLRQFGSNASALMATHPATEDRIRRLQALGRW
jgi:heat shock protein HtpX